MKYIPRRPPEIKGGAILGVWQEYLRNPPAFLEKAARDGGDIARFRLVQHKAYLLNHPDWIKEVLVTNQANFTKSRALERARVLLGDGLLTSEGDFHRRQRRLAQPAFHRDRLAGYARSMVDCAVRSPRAMAVRRRVRCVAVDDAAQHGDCRPRAFQRRHRFGGG